MDLINRVNSFLELGRRIENLDHQSLHQVIEKANIQNPWFTEPFVRHAITGILNLRIKSVPDEVEEGFQARIAGSLGSLFLSLRDLVEKR